ncbi:MAG: hypothetical protein BAJALOKI3v1_50131 [Promethearchaeota archaeon]|nr:MAG: hypothetical protein BAJALOKI3v1_50131 [Candidatus Lokiarchaeota archaeon]
MSANRVHYATQLVALGEYSTGSGTEVHGVQSVSTNTSFNLEQVTELGQLEIYENIENLPDVEVTIEKVLDGYPLIWHLATPTASSNKLVNRSNLRTDMLLNIYDDDQSNASGTPLTQVYCSGLYTNSLNYTLPVDGNSTESVTFVGNDKVWRSSSFVNLTGFDGTDSPASGVQRRQDVIMGVSGTASVWPTLIPGMQTINGSGYNPDNTGEYSAHVQDVTISVNFNRDDLFELGRKNPYYRYANFPIAVDCTINTSPGGTTPGDFVNARSDVDNLTDEPILIKLEDSTTFNLGTKNKLQTISQTGGDAGGGVMTVSYSFQNLNALEISQNSDPAGL